MADEQESGRALDRLIGERLFAYQVVPGEWGGYQLAQASGKRLKTYSVMCSGGRDADMAWQWDCPKFSTSVAAAWLIVERMRRHQEGRNLQLMVYAYNRTYATFVKHAGDHDEWCEANGQHATPLAICLAALEACPEGVDVWLPDDLFGDDDE